MSRDTLIQFPGISVSEANQLAADLQDYLHRNALESEAQVQIIKEQGNTMDFGATLAITLGTGSVIALARGIANWLQRQQGRSITIRNGDKEINGSNLSSKDIANILEKVNNI